MRENVDLERDILLYLEENDVNNEGFRKNDFLNFIKNSDFEELFVLKHCRLLEERGYINFSTQPGDDNPFCLYHVGPIKAKGYDFIASTRDNKTWNKIKDKLVDKGFDATITVAVDNLLPLIVKSMLM